MTQTTTDKNGILITIDDETINLNDQTEVDNAINEAIDFIENRYTRYHIFYPHPTKKEQHVVQEAVINDIEKVKNGYIKPFTVTINNHDCKIIPLFGLTEKDFNNEDLEDLTFLMTSNVFVEKDNGKYIASDY